MKKLIMMTTALMVCLTIYSAINDLKNQNTHNTINTPSLPEYNNKPSKLHVAVQNNNLNEVKKLINSGFNVNTTYRWPSSGVYRDGHGSTPLHLALLQKNNDIAKFLIDKGANLTMPDDDGVTPLHLVQNVEMLRLILSKIKNPTQAISTEDNWEGTPLEYALGWCNIDIANELIKNKAVLYPNAEAIYSGLTKPNCDLEKYINTLIQYNPDMSDWLKQQTKIYNFLTQKGITLKTNQNPKTFPNIRESLYTPFMSADIKLELATLISGNSDTHSINRADEDGNTVLLRIAGHDRFMINQKIRFIQKLIELGADFNIKNNKKETFIDKLLQSTPPHQKISLDFYLFDMAKGINIPIEDKKTLITMLASNGLNINDQDPTGSTPLASLMNDEQISTSDKKILIELYRKLEANDITNSFKETPIQSYIRNDNISLTEKKELIKLFKNKKGLSESLHEILYANISKSEKINFMKELINNGANIFEIDPHQSETALTLMIQHDGDFSIEEKLDILKTAASKNPIVDKKDLAEHLFYTVNRSPHTGKQKIEFIKIFIQVGADVNMRNDTDETTLSFLLKNNRIPIDDMKEIAQFLVQNGADVNIGGFEGTPLQNLIFNDIPFRDKKDLIVFLIKNGANTNLTDSRNVHIDTLILRHYAFSLNDKKELIQLLHNTQTTEISTETTPVNYQNIDFFKQIAKWGNTQKNKNNGKTMSLFTVLNQNTNEDETLSLLEFYIKNGASVNEKDSIGRTPLEVILTEKIFSQEENKAKALSIIIENGSDLDMERLNVILTESDLKSTDKQLLTSIIIKNKKTSLTQTLPIYQILELNNISLDEKVNLLTQSLKSSSQKSKQDLLFDIYFILIKPDIPATYKTELTEPYLDQININQTISSACSLLCIVAIEKTLTFQDKQIIMTSLIKHGADANAILIDETLLTYFTRLDDVDMVKILLSSNPDITKQDSKGHRPTDLIKSKEMQLLFDKYSQQ